MQTRDLLKTVCPFMALLKCEAYLHRHESIVYAGRKLQHMITFTYVKISENLLLSEKTFLLISETEFKNVWSDLTSNFCELLGATQAVVRHPKLKLNRKLSRLRGQSPHCLISRIIMIWGILLCTGRDSGKYYIPINN